MRPSLILIALWLISGALLQSQQRPAPFVASSVDLVVLPVVVLDKGGGFVTNLDRDRFNVYDNGRRQEIALFTGEDAPVTVGLVIDNSGSMRPKMPEVIVGTLAFARSSNPNDELFTVPFNDTVAPSAGRSLVTADDSAALESQLHAMTPEGRTALYDALLAGLDRVGQSPQARKALVLISDGGDNASRATLDEVLARARHGNITIFTLGLFDDDDPDRNPTILRRLAESTGGERFLPRTPSLLLQACTRIARELRSAYTIGYAPPDRDGAFHRVRVEVQPDKGAKVSVRSRPGYFAAPASAGHE